MNQKFWFPFVVRFLRFLIGVKTDEKFPLDIESVEEATLILEKLKSLSALRGFEVSEVSWDQLSQIEKDAIVKLSDMKRDS